MKKLTLDLLERIIDAVYEKSKHSPDMEIGDGTRQNCAEYICFYAFHNELFWNEQDGKICGIATFHAGRSDFSWNWPDFDDGSWTLHLVWSDNVNILHEMFVEFLSKRKNPVTEFWTWRNDGLVELTQAKLKRLFYGKRRKHHSNPSASSAKLQRVNEVDPASTG